MCIHIEASEVIAGMRAKKPVHNSVAGQEKTRVEE
jgi:hypothetical protein